MNIEELNHPLVKAALEAMKAGDRERWFALFTPDALLTDDGSERAFADWADTEVFGQNKGYLKSVDSVEDDGRMIVGKFHSDRWGEFDTYMKFTIQDDKITRLDVGQMDT